MRSLKSLLTIGALLASLSAVSASAAPVLIGKTPATIKSGTDSVMVADSSNDGLGKGYFTANNRPYVVRDPSAIVDTNTLIPTGQKDTVVTPEHDIIAIVNVNSGAGMYINYLGKDVSKPVTPVANLVFTTTTDTLIDGYVHKFIDNGNNSELKIEQENKMVPFNTQVSFSTNGRTYTSRWGFVGNIGLRWGFTVSDNSNYSIGDTRKITAKGVTKDVAEAAYDSVTGNVLLTSGTKKVVGGQNDTVNVDGLEVLISKVNNGGTSELRGIDTATQAENPNSISFNSLSDKYVSANGDTVKIVDVLGDTAVVKLTTKGGQSYTEKIKMKDTVDFADGTKVTINNAFKGKDQTGANVVYVDGTYDKSTTVISRVPRNVRPSYSVSALNNTSTIYDVRGRIVGHNVPGKLIRNPSGMYIQRNADGTRTKFLIRK